MYIQQSVIGADFLGAMVAKAPMEMGLVGACGAPVEPV